MYVFQESCRNHCSQPTDEFERKLSGNVQQDFAKGEERRGEHLAWILSIIDILKLFYDIAYPRTNEEAGANVTLHCRGMNALVIKYNPGNYVIQQSVFDVDTWDTATVVLINTFYCFSNLNYYPQLQLFLSQILLDTIERNKMIEKM